MEALLLTWLTPLGLFSLVAAGNLVLSIRTAREQTKSNAVLQKLETNTNSIKDALVASTAKASDLEGEKRGLAIAAAAQEAKDTA